MSENGDRILPRGTRKLAVLAGDCRRVPLGQLWPRLPEESRRRMVLLMGALSQGVRVQNHVRGKTTAWNEFGRKRRTSIVTDF